MELFTLMPGLKGQRWMLKAESYPGLMNRLLLKPIVSAAI